MRQSRDRKSTRLNSSHQINTLSLHDALPISQDGDVLLRQCAFALDFAEPFEAHRAITSVRKARRRAKPRVLTRIAGLPNKAARLFYCRRLVKDRYASVKRSEEHTSELQSPDQHSFPTRRSSDLARWGRSAPPMRFRA